MSRAKQYGPSQSAPTTSTRVESRNRRPGAVETGELLCHGARRCRQGVEGVGEGGRPDLERGTHGSLRLVRGEVAGGDFPAGFVEFGRHRIGQFEPVFDVILLPGMELFQLRPREFGDGRFNFLNSAHDGKTTSLRPFAKPGFPTPNQGAKPATYFRACQPFARWRLSTPETSQGL